MLRTDRPTVMNKKAQALRLGKAARVNEPRGQGAGRGCGPVPEWWFHPTRSVT